MNVVLLLVYLAVAIGFSFLCSIAEAVLLSITPSFIAEKRQEGSKTAAKIVELKSNIDRPLSAILSLNTIAHTVGAAGVGAQATKVFGDHMVGVISAVLTLLILVFSEIIPKTIGAMHWRTLASPIATLVRWLIFVMLPLVWLSEFLTKILSRGKKQSVITRSEIAAMAELGSQEGLLQHHESRILKAMLQLDSIRVEDIMTPRTVVIALEESSTLESIADEIKQLPVSRIPLFQERRDHVTGFVLKDELLTALASGETQKRLSEFSRPLTAVKEDDSITVVFDRFLNDRLHIVLVTDHFGGMEGILTMEDLVETLLEVEIVDELDATVDMRKLARAQWNKRLKKHGIPAPTISQQEENLATKPTPGHQASG